MHELVLVSHSLHLLHHRLLLHLLLLLLLRVVVPETLGLHDLSNWLERGQRIQVCRILKVLLNDVVVHGEQTVALKPVLDLEHVVSLVLHFHEELLFFL